MNETKIVWGVDMLGDEGRTRAPMADFLRLWSLGLAVRVEPVFVASSSQVAAKAPLYEFGPVKTLIAASATLRSRVESLLAYAGATKSSAIALTTHARTGLMRLALGSFAEAAVLRSRLPLLTLNPTAKPARKLGGLLFATDFSRESSWALRVAVKEARLRNLKLILLHGARIDREHPEASFGPAEGYFAFKGLYLRRKRTQLHAAAQRARNAGVETEEILLDQGEDLTSAILEAARRRSVSVIAMTSHCGAVDAALGGSLTRSIIRAAPCAVWAISPPP